jgi:hypothetical protein
MGSPLIEGAICCFHLILGRRNDFCRGRDSDKPTHRAAAHGDLHEWGNGLENNCTPTSDYHWTASKTIMFCQSWPSN